MWRSKKSKQRKEEFSAEIRRRTIETYLSGWVGERAPMPRDQWPHEWENRPIGMVVVTGARKPSGGWYIDYNFTLPDPDRLDPRAGFPRRVEYSRRPSDLQIVKRRSRPPNPGRTVWR